MRIMMLSTLVLLGACTANARNVATPGQNEADAIKLAKALDGLTPGRPQSCIAPSRVNYHTEAIGDTILYRVSKNLVYRTNAPGCDGATRGEALVTINPGAQLCQGQIVRTIDFFSRVEPAAARLATSRPIRARS